MCFLPVIPRTPFGFIGSAPLSIPVWASLALGRAAEAPLGGLGMRLDAAGEIQHHGPRTHSQQVSCGEVRDSWEQGYVELEAKVGFMGNLRGAPSTGQAGPHSGAGALHFGCKIS